MKVSIITAVLNSHEIVRRQILHYEKMNLSDDVEIIFMDDGSKPPLNIKTTMKNFYVHQTNDDRAWTEHIARNRGIELSRGEYLILIDIDYILPREAIEAVRNFDGDRMNFKRRFGALDKTGNIVYDRKTLESYKLKSRWFKTIYFPGHRSQFAMNKKLFLDFGKYREDLSGVNHPMGGGAGQRFWQKWMKAERKGSVVASEIVPEIFMFPAGKFCISGGDNPLGLFHDLRRETNGS